MINPMSIAVLGIHPGFSTFNCATLGYGFEIKVTISSGGSDLEVTELRDSRRLVTVEVFYKNHHWKQSLWVETIVIDKVVQISSSIRSVKEKMITVVTRIRDELKKISVTVINKNKT